MVFKGYLMINQNCGLAAQSIHYLRVPVSSFDLVKQLQFSLERMLPSGVGFFADQIKESEESFEYPEEGRHLSNAEHR